MAWSDFYMQTTGSDLNAGSTTANASSVTSTNGNWSTATNIFTAAAGTPFSAVLAGEWVSIYVDGAAKTTFIAQVVSVGGGGASVTVSTTNRLGTAPTTSATTRTCKVGGAWASFDTFNSSVFAAGTAGTPMRINVKAATYANAGNNRLMIAAGATTAPIWFRGYNTTPGDIDTNNSLTKPALTFTTGTIGLAAHVIFSYFTLTSTTAAQPVMSTVATNKVVRCRFDNQNAAAASRCISAGGGIFVQCYFKATTTADSCFRNTSGNSLLVGCAVEGAIVGVFGSGNMYLSHCVIFNSVTNAITLAALTSYTIDHCTIYNVAGAGISIAGAPALMSYIMNCILSNCGTFGISQTAGTDTNLIFASGNDFFSCSSGNYNGITESLSFFDQTEASTPFTTPGSDFTLVTGRNAIDNAIPGIFENQSYVSASDIGAVEKVTAAGSSGASAHGFS